MNTLDILGFLGFFFLAICWIPETIATIKRGNVSIKISFLILYFLGSASLLTQAAGLVNLPLILLNSFTTLTSGINLFYGLKNKF